MVVPTPCAICGKPTPYVVHADSPLQPTHPECRDDALSNEAYWDAPDDRIHLVIDGCPPGWGRKNRKYRARGSKLLSDEYKTFCDYVWAAWMTAGKPRLDKGGLSIEIHVYWKRKRKLDDGHVTAYADVDAVTSVVLDALQDKKDKAGNIIERCLFDNDMRVESKVVRKFVDKDHPRVEVWVGVDS